MKEEYTMILIGTEKFWTKLQVLQPNRIHVWKPTANILLHDERQKTFPLKTKTKDTHFHYFYSS